jgi:hypothetical protein
LETYEVLPQRFINWCLVLWLEVVASSSPPDRVNRGLQVVVLEGREGMWRERENLATRSHNFLMCLA